MKKGLNAVLVCIFLVVTLLLLGAFNLTKPRILVVHSAQRSVSTVQRLDAGIRAVLDANRQPMSVRWHYLGIDTMSDEDHREDAAKIGARAIAQFDPDLVIAVDDEAQHYLMRRYGGRARPKIMFTAIDQEPALYGYGQAANVTGIMERLPLAAVRDTLAQALPGKPLRLAVIGSTGPTGTGQMRQVQTFDWAPHRVESAHSLADFASWKAAIQAMQGTVDAVLVLSYGGLHASATDTSLVPPAVIVRWTEANAQPLPMGVSLDYVELGGALSIAPSARDMGAAAATQALVWLKAKPGDPAPTVSQEGHYSIAMRAGALQTRNVHLPSIYTEAARMGQLYFP